jgi:hypothetical protein
MRRTTGAVLALAGAAMTAPAAALAAEATDPPSPLRTALRAPLAGHVTVADQMRAERAENVRDRLTDRALREARRGDVSVREERRRLRGSSAGELRDRIRELRRERRRDAREAREPEVPATPAASPTLEAIAACESGGDPTTNTGNGFYGKYQFTLPTWQSVGGSGNPAAASEAEQDMRAAMLYAREGAAPWPVCGG